MERALRMVISIFVFAVLAQYLGPEQFGIFNFAVAFVALFTPVLALGLNRPVVRQLIEERLEAQTLMLSVFVIRLAAAFIMIILVLVGIYFQSTTELAANLIIIIALGFLFQPFDVIALWYESQIRSRFTVFAKFAAFGLASSVKLILIAQDAPLVWFAWSNVLELALGAAFICWFYFAQTRDFSSARLRPNKVLNMLRKSWPAIPAALGISACMRLDQIMLEYLVDFRAVGVYAAGSRLSEAWFFLTGAVVTSAFPILIHHRSDDRKEYRENLGRLMLLVYCVALVIVIPTILAGEWIVHFLYGTEYQQSAEILKIHIVSLIPMAFGQASGLWIYAEWKIMLDLYRALLGVSVNVALNLMLIPIYGPSGAAVATVVSLIAAFYLFDMLVPSMRQLFLQKSRALLLVGLPSELKFQMIRLGRLLNASSGKR